MKPAVLVGVEADDGPTLRCGDEANIVCVDKSYVVEVDQAMSEHVSF